MGDIKPAQAIEQRGLAGPVGADEAGDLARCHVERDVVEGDDAAEPDRQGADAEQRLTAGRFVAHVQASTPRVRIATAMRCMACAGSASRPARSARRNSSARCSVERALSCPPTMVKWVWCPLR